MAGLDTLDEFSPKDTDAVSLGDDAIRETRAKTKGTVGLEHYLDGPHKIPFGPGTSRPAAGRPGRLYFNTDTKALEYDAIFQWAGVADAKARACILWHSTQSAAIPGGVLTEFPFDYVLDDPGGYAAPQYHQIVQPANSIGIVSAYLEFAHPTNLGYGVFAYIEQFDGAAWQKLTYAWTGPAPALSMHTMVDSRWGLQLRVTIMNGTPNPQYVNATPLGASPRFGYAMLGRTS